MGNNHADDRHTDDALVTSADPGVETPPWELVDVGRYKPRRIRGSFRGRELG